MTRTILQLSGIALLGLAISACAEQPKHVDVDLHDKDDDDTVGDAPDKPGTQPEDTVGDEDSTFDHPAGIGENDARDPYEIAQQREEEGSPEARARLHSCQKVQIAALRNMLTDFGVDMEAEADPPSAGQLLDGGATALGQSNYEARMGEDIVWTAAGAAKTFDIYVQAAPEIIAAMPQTAHCQLAGAPTQVFDADGSCNADGVTCLIGRPATEEHLAICNSLVNSSSTPENGKNIAVAALLSAAHSCE